MDARGSLRILAAAACAAGLAAFALSLWVASREWWSRDDFAFLTFVQRSETWTWATVYLPLGERFWPFYRPLGMETFFWVGFRLFGLDAFGTFAIAVVLHFATALLVFRIARRIGLAPVLALATATLAVTRPPSLLEIYWGSVFMYVGAVAFGLLAIERFLAGWPARASGARAASCAALGLALLCNESAALLPVAIALAAVASGAGVRDLPCLARALLPHALVTAAWAGLRFGILAADPPSELYRLALGAHVPENALALWSDLVGGRIGAAAALAVTAGAIAVIATGRERAPGAAGRGPRAALACLTWAALATIPFALLPFAQPRWAMNLEAPACLALGALLEAARRSLPARRAAVFELALAAGLVASVPWSALVERGRSPLAAPLRPLAAAVATPPADPARHAPVVLLFGAPGLADAAQGERLRELSFGGALRNALDPDTTSVLRFLDLSRRPARAALRADGRYLVLRPDGRVEPADAASLARELPRGLATRESGIGRRDAP